MQDSKKTKSRKAWYQKAMQVANLWRIVLRFPDHPNYSVDHSLHSNANNNAKLRKCSSTSSAVKNKSAPSPAYYVAGNATPPRTPPRTLSYPSSLTRSCLSCAPINYSCDLQPTGARRSFNAAVINTQTAVAPVPFPFPSPRVAESINGVQPRMRKVFRGKSVMDNSLMRRSVIEEEAMMMRRRDEFAFMQRRNSLKRRQIGPSPLSRVVNAD
eukprot:Gb_21528 [translate_table: standard]